MINYIKNFILEFLCFGVPMGLFWAIMFDGIDRGIVLGVAGGIFFACFITGFSIYEEYKLINVVKSKFKCEDIIYGDLANMINEYEAIGGYLVLLKDRIYFISHNINLCMKTTECTITLEEVYDIGKARKARSIYINKKNFETIVFVVNNNKKWIKLLEDQLKQYKLRKRTNG